MFLPESKLNRAQFLKDGGCSDPVLLVLLKSFSTEMEVFIVIFGVTETKSLCCCGMIFLSQDLKMFVIIFIQNAQDFFSSFEDWVEKNTLVRPLFTNPVKSQ